VRGLDDYPPHPGQRTGIHGGDLFMALSGIQDALRMRKESENAQRESRLKVVEAAEHYKRDCLTFRRWRRHGATLKAIQPELPLKILRSIR